MTSLCLPLCFFVTFGEKNVDSSDWIEHGHISPLSSEEKIYFDSKDRHSIFIDLFTTEGLTWGWRWPQGVTLTPNIQKKYQAAASLAAAETVWLRERCVSLTGFVGVMWPAPWARVESMSSLIQWYICSCMNAAAELLWEHRESVCALVSDIISHLWSWSSDVWGHQCCLRILKSRFGCYINSEAKHNDTIWIMVSVLSPQNDQSTEELHIIGSRDLSFLRGKVRLSAGSAGFQELRNEQKRSNAKLMCNFPSR